MVKDRVRKLMEEKGMKVQALAFYAGVSDASIYNVLNGADVKLSTVYRIAKALGVKVTALIDDDRSDEFLEDKIEALDGVEE